MDANLTIMEPVDTPLDEVYEEILSMDPDGERMSKVFRTTFDQLYDGQRTGRYSVDQLFKTEKTHFGTLIEINIQREFEFDGGSILDFNILGHEVDCKYSHTGKWMLPMESFDQIALVTQANDLTSKWSAGLVRVTELNRRSSENRDRKTGLNSLGRSRIKWLYQEWPMQPNALLQAPESVVKQIMSARSGQSRLNQLFRELENQRISRNIIATVAQQFDYMKRVRANGGSRGTLRPEGYLILSGDYKNQQNIARALEATVPEAGEMVSVRVVPSEPGTGAPIGNGWWRLAASNERILYPAPQL